MNSITRRVPFRLTPFSIIGLLLAIAGCGTITIDIRTDIASRQEITQNLEYVISGPLAALFITDGEIDLGDDAELADLDAINSAGWDFEMDVVEVDGEDAFRMRVSQTFTGEDAAEQFRLASETLAEEDSSTSMIPLLDITETEDEVVYELRMSVSADDIGDPSAGFEDTLPPDDPLIVDGTPLPGLDFGEFDPFTGGLEDFGEALEASFEDMVTLKWTVEMPGDVTETNATSEEGSVLTWDLGFAELSESDSELFAKSVVNKNAGGNCS